MEGIAKKPGHCSRCGVKKTPQNTRRHPDGLQALCKECTKGYNYEKKLEGMEDNWLSSQLDRYKRLIVSLEAEIGRRIYDSNNQRLASRP